MTYEIARLNYHFSQILGKIPTCIRPPYGDFGDLESNSSSLKVLQAMGYGLDAQGGIIGWNFDSQDWKQDLYGANNTDRQLFDMSASLNGTIPSGAIALLHDTSPISSDFRPFGSLIPLNIKPFTQVAIEYLSQRNFVTVDECIGNPVGSMYRPVTKSDLVCGDKACTE